MLAGVATVAIIFGAAAIIAAGGARASAQGDMITAAGPHFSNSLVEDRDLIPARIEQIQGSALAAGAPGPAGLTMMILVMGGARVLSRCRWGAAPA